MSKEQNKNIEEKIEGQVELDETPTFEETIKMAVDIGLVAVDPAKVEEAVELGIVDKSEIEKYEAKEGSDELELKDGDCISREKVLNCINTTMAKYETKVVLAMSEVRDIINAIITVVKE